MSNSAIERRLFEIAKRLRRATEELAVLDEQLQALSDAADEARVRSLVSETPLARKEYTEAQRHADALARSRGTLLASIAGMRRSQDELLDKLVVGTE
jgi:chromosome segregation ATPase